MNSLQDRLIRARNLFSVDDEGRDVLVILFNCLETELCVRSSLEDDSNYSGAKAKTLAGFFLYTTQRFEEVFVQLSQLEWMKAKFIAAQNQERGLWHAFAPLLVKSFHIAVVSLMDSLGPLSICIRDSLSEREQTRLPDFPDTLKKHRNRIPTTVLDCLDSAESWYNTVREVRNLLVHRRHHQIILGGPEEGLVFQVEERRLGPKIVLPVAAWKPGEQNHEFVDFPLYSTWIVAELLILLDELGTIISAELGLIEDLSDRARRKGDFGVLRSTLDRLIDRAVSLSVVEGGI